MMCSNSDWQMAMSALHDDTAALERALGPVYFHRVRQLLEDAEFSRQATDSPSPLERSLAEYSFQRRAEQAIALMDEVALG